jgi:tetratricopeptide (TPR) repeat protein
LRQRLVAHRLDKNAEVLASGDYEVLVEHLVSITELYTPEEIEGGALPLGLEPIARELVTKGSPRGDEARVLSGWLVLHKLRPDDAAATEGYHEVRTWVFDSRAALNPPLERFEEGLCEVWEEHARLTPTPKVLATLARLYVERRNALIAVAQAAEQRFPFSEAMFEGAQQTAFSVAGVYLRHGDIAAATTHLSAMGAARGEDGRLLELLEAAREEGGEGSGALLELAARYLRRGRPDVAHGVCVTGLRGDLQDPRFPRCLAHVAAEENDFAGAMAWYGEALRLLPDERTLYDEILEVLSGLMERGLFGTDSEQTRMIATRTAEILEERVRRWPKAPPAIRVEELYLAIGVVEMNAGNAAAAEERLRKSLAIKETLGAQLQLGLLLERIGRSREAADVYRRALALLGKNGGEGEPRRAEILERLGDALRLLGNGQEASKVYEQGLALWDENLSRHKGQRIGLAHLRRGVLLGRLARRQDSVFAFEKAMELAPEVRETYATILAYLAVSEPDSGFAHRVFRNALNQLSLEPEWKVYFAMWLRIVAARNGGALEGDVNEVLADLAVGTDWWAKLAQYGSGKLDFDGLLAAASDVGERTEAYFYEGARRLAAGDALGAREMFELVLSSNMVNFYEFAMAQELIEKVPAQAAAPREASVQPAK